MGYIACLFGLIVFLTILMAGTLMWAWNLVVPVFWATAPILNFWQALALMILINFVTGMFRVRVNKKDD